MAPSGANQGWSEHAPTRPPTVYRLGSGPLYIYIYIYIYIYYNEIRKQTLGPENKQPW
jgi:hypothetical protein